MEIIALGDSALLVRVPAQARAEELLSAVLDVMQRIEAAALPGVLEVAPAAASVGVFFQPGEVSGAGATAFETLRSQIDAALAGPSVSSDTQPAAGELEIPICYEGEFAPDLADVARHSGLSPQEVVRQHSGACYLVACVGFLPGFGYLAGLPPKLATPRRASPRTAVPAGAVGIGGAQTGIYPSATPGGWNIIGRTPRRMFDPTRATPALLQAGVTVRFRAISRAEFDAFDDDSTTR